MVVYKPENFIVTEDFAWFLRDSVNVKNDLWIAFRYPHSETVADWEDACLATDIGTWAGVPVWEDNFPTDADFLAKRRAIAAVFNMAESEVPVP